MKKPIKSKRVKVSGVITSSTAPMCVSQEFDCIISNDERGKTLSINNGIMQFTIPFEPIERYLK